jgi:hypothetical protein
MNQYRVTYTPTNVYADVFAADEGAARNKGCAALGDAEWDEVSVQLLHEGGFLVDILWLSGIYAGKVGQRRIQVADRDTLEFLHGVGSEWTVEETGARFRITAHPQ